jgi:hypothetical protein
MISTPAFAPVLMDLQTAAYYLGVSTRQVEKLQRLGDITPLANGGKKVFHRDELDKYAAGLAEWTRGGG